MVPNFHEERPNSDLSPRMECIQEMQEQFLRVSPGMECLQEMPKQFLLY